MSNKPYRKRYGPSPELRDRWIADAERYQERLRRISFYREQIRIQEKRVAQAKSTKEKEKTQLAYLKNLLKEIDK